jgi:GTP cyclohydrolase II
MAILDSNINGEPETFAVERALFELRRGRAFRITDEKCCMLVASVETVGAMTFERLKHIGHRQSLIITNERAKVVGLPTGNNSSLAIILPRQMGLTTVKRLAGIALPHSKTSPNIFHAETCNPAAAASLELAKIARLVPALISVELPPRNLDDSVMTVQVESLHSYIHQFGRTIQRISEARVPLAGHENSRFILFRDALMDEEHLAIMIGKPDPYRPVPVRLHSACLTGDVFESLRCDCGEQLRGAVKRIAAAGGGVMLYLAQEGRGIGLANKFRAYELQDTGLDTLQADQHLGFRTDERNYRAAAAMLRDLKMTRIYLLTNNPEKMQALADDGIEVLNRLPLVTSLNPHNERYVRTKLERAGHLPHCKDDLDLEPCFDSSRLSSDLTAEET